MSTHYILFAESAILFAVAILTLKSQITRYTTRILSNVLNAYLARRHVIRNIDDGTAFPSCEYVWPNGQGDAAKFLNGQKNSEAWEASFGAIYRLWSGMTSEV